MNREIYCTYVTLGLLLLSFCVPRLKYTVLQRDLFFRFPTYCKARQVTFALSTHKSLLQPKTAHRFAKKSVKSLKATEVSHPFPPSWVLQYVFFFFFLWELLFLKAFVSAG